MSVRLVRWLAVLALQACLFHANAFAHDARPVSVSIREVGDKHYAVRMRAPGTVLADNVPTVVLPPACSVSDGANAARPDSTGFIFSCPAGLAGQELSIAFPIYNPSLATLFRLERKGRSPITELVPPDQASWRVPSVPNTFEVFTQYLQLGISHIFAGLDHLLFVAGFVALARTGRRVLIAVTGFTIAHSLTLALSVLDVVRLPPEPVEAVIALSILFVARELIRPHDQGLAIRHPVSVATFFGLLHGFGFAGVLRDLGLPEGEVATALVGFNLGVEAGQLIFISVIWLTTLALRAARPVLPITSGGLIASGGYVMGITAMVWFLERSTEVV